MIPGRCQLLGSDRDEKHCRRFWMLNVLKREERCVSSRPSISGAPPGLESFDRGLESLGLLKKNPSSGMQCGRPAAALPSSIRGNDGCRNQTHQPQRGDCGRLICVTFPPSQFRTKTRDVFQATTLSTRRFICLDQLSTCCWKFQMPPAATARECSIFSPALRVTSWMTYDRSDSKSLPGFVNAM